MDPSFTYTCQILPSLLYFSHEKKSKSLHSAEHLTCPTKWMKATMAMAWKMEGIAFEIRRRTAGRGILAANHRRGHSTVSQSQVGVAL
jgi:hypothetical protein